MLRNLYLAAIICLIALLGACSGNSTPAGITPVHGFDSEKYLGNWYEIARLDHSFEQGLELVTATYGKRDDGGLSVSNRGYNSEKRHWNEATGKAYFTGAPDIGKLKVSFFGPFYGAYNIIALDRTNYSYAMICGPDKHYLWILSRTPQLSFPIKAQLIAQARALGFDTDKLIYVRQ